MLFDGYFGIDSALSAPASICTYQAITCIPICMAWHGGTHSTCFGWGYTGAMIYCSVKSHRANWLDEETWLMSVCGLWLLGARVTTEIWGIGSGGKQGVNEYFARCNYLDGNMFQQLGGVRFGGAGQTERCVRRARRSWAQPKASGWDRWCWAGIGYKVLGWAISKVLGSEALGRARRWCLGSEVARIIGARLRGATCSRQGS